MTYEVQQTRWDRIIRRVSGSIGPGSRVSETISELFPVLDVESVPHELLALGGIRTAMISIQRTGAVGQLSSNNLFNPLNSGVIASVTSVFIDTGTAQNIAIDIVQANLSAGQTRGLFRDSRLGGDRLSTLFATSQTGITTDNILRILLAANERMQLTDPNGVVVLSPGNGLQLGTTATNTLLQTGFLWRERPVEESELNLE